MEKIATENLFLLEFLVDKVNITKSDSCMPCVTDTVCVSVQFLDNAPLDICDDDFESNDRCGGGKDTVKSGKSCLFSLTPQQACEASREFNVFVSIFQKAEVGVLPEKVQVGCALISICNLFNELVESVAEATGRSPTAKTMKDTFDILGPTGDVIGCLGIYIRMSCFGKLIVTQFQMNLQDKTVLFKDKEGHSLYRYKKAKKDKCQQKNKIRFDAPPQDCSRRGFSSQHKPPMDPCGGRGSSTQYNSCMDPCGGRSASPQYSPSMDPRGGRGAFSQYNQPMDPCAENNYNACSNAGNPCGGMQTGPLTPYPSQPLVPSLSTCPPLPDSPGNYEEIGASMGGNRLTLRIHKNSKVEAVGDHSDSGSCGCGANKMLTNGDGSAVTGNVCVSPCEGGNQEVNVNSCNQDRPFELKLGGCGATGNGGGRVTIIPPACPGKDGATYTELSDPKKEVFILRIGKKSEGVNKKNNLELELCTPKGPELKPAPLKCTRDAQYDYADFGGTPPGEGSKGKGKGKGKKGKGKGKDNALGFGMGGGGSGGRYGGGGGGGGDMCCRSRVSCYAVPVCCQPSYYTMCPSSATTTCTEVSRLASCYDVCNPCRRYC